MDDQVATENSSPAMCVGQLSLFPLSQEIASKHTRPIGEIIESYDV